MSTSLMEHTARAERKRESAERPATRLDKPRDESLRAWGEQVIANAMDGLVTA